MGNPVWNGRTSQTEPLSQHSGLNSLGVGLCTVNQQMFVDWQKTSLLMFAFLSGGELDGKPCFTKMTVTSLRILRFSILELLLKQE